MRYSLSIPDQLEAPLIEAFGHDLDRAAREALALEGYRLRKFGTGVVAELLEFPDRWHAEAWLAEKGLNRQYSVADLREDRTTLAALLLPRA